MIEPSAGPQWPHLETARLLLRPPLLEDMDGWAAMMADEPCARFIGGLQPRAVVWRALTCMAGAWLLQGFAMFSVIEKSTGRWIGRLGPWQPEGWPGQEVGWAIARDCWGRGYALEGATAAMDFVFEELGWEEVIHSIAPENLASQKLAQRLGSMLRGPGKLPAPYENNPIDLWGQTRAQWRAGRAARMAQVARGA